MTGRSRTSSSSCSEGESTGIESRLSECQVVAKRLVCMAAGWRQVDKSTPDFPCPYSQHFRSSQRTISPVPPPLAPRAKGPREGDYFGMTHDTRCKSVLREHWDKVLRLKFTFPRPV